MRPRRLLWVVGSSFIVGALAACGASSSGRGPGRTGGSHDASAGSGGASSSDAGSEAALDAAGANGGTAGTGGASGTGAAGGTAGTDGGVAVGLVGGFGEGYAANWYGSNTPTVASATSAWNAILAKPNLQKWQKKFHWNVVRLGFLFKNLTDINPAAPGYVLDSTNADGTLDVLDKVIGIVSSAGYRVELTYMAEAGPASTTDLNNLISDWTRIAKHYQGDTRIAMYQLCNEMADTPTIDSAYGSKQGFLCALVDKVRAYEPSRTCAWIMGINSKSCPSPTRSNLYTDWHVSTYANSSIACSSTTPCPDAGGLSGHDYTCVGSTCKGCMEESQISNWPSGMLKFQSTCGQKVINGEINAQTSYCNSHSIQWVQQMVDDKIPYIAWGYNEYAAEWDAILSAVTP